MAPLPIEKFVHIDVHGMAAGGEHNTLDPRVIKALRQIIALGHPLVHVVEVAAFIQAAGQRHDVPAAHTAVGVIAVAGDLLDLQQYAHIGLHAAVLIEFREVLPE